MRSLLASVSLLAASLGSVPDAQAGPILDRIRADREARRGGCQSAPTAAAAGCASCAGCQSAPSFAPAPTPTVQLWGGTYYQTAPAFTGGCPTCAGGKCYPAGKAPPTLPR